MFHSVEVSNGQGDSAQREQLVVDVDAAGSELYFALSDMANQRHPRTVLHAIIRAGEPQSVEEIATTLGEAPWEIDQRVAELEGAGVLLTDESQEGRVLYSVL